MRPQRPALVATLLVALAAAVACAVPPAHAAPEVVFAQGESLMNVSAEPDAGTSLAITGRRLRDRFGHDSYDLRASPLDASGQTRGSGRLFGGAMKADMGMGSPPFVAVATDTRRGRHLVAWPAHKPGMGRTPCPPSELPPVFVFATNPQCAWTDSEIFVRVLDRSGSARGPERQVTSIGPPDRGEFSSAGAALAYDERNDSALLVFAARATGDEFRAALFAQRLSADGTPAGPVRLLALQPQPVGVGPLLARLAADPRGGFLLAYTWGSGLDDRRLFTRRLRHDGRPTGATSTVTGDGVGDIRLAFDRRRRRALVVYSSSAPGAETGVRARLLAAEGRPIAAPVDLPYRLGHGLPVVTSDRTRGGWTYGFVREFGTLRRLQVLVQRAQSTGEPDSAAQLVSQADHEAYMPAVAAVRGGTVLAAWGENEMPCPVGTGCMAGAPRVHARLIRPSS